MQFDETIMSYMYESDEEEDMVIEEDEYEAQCLELAIQESLCGLVEKREKEEMNGDDFFLQGVISDLLPRIIKFLDPSSRGHLYSVNKKFYLINPKYKTQNPFTQDPLLNPSRVQSYTIIIFDWQLDFFLWDLNNFMTSMINLSKLSLVILTSDKFTNLHRNLTSKLLLKRILSPLPERLNSIIQIKIRHHQRHRMDELVKDFKTSNQSLLNLPKKEFNIQIISPNGSICVEKFWVRKT